MTPRVADWGTTATAVTGGVLAAWAADGWAFLALGVLVGGTLWVLILWALRRWRDRPRRVHVVVELSTGPFETTGMLRPVSGCITLDAPLPETPQTGAVVHGLWKP